MSFNARLAAIFDRMSAMLELTGADRFRVNAHAKAARVIGDHPSDLEPIAHDAKALIAIEGIGKGTAAKIAEFAESGAISEHGELAAKVPVGVLELLEIQGLGPKTVKLLWEDKGVESIADLKKIIEDGSIITLPRMGEKTVENIKESIAFLESSGQRLHLGIAMPIAEAVVERMKRVSGVKDCTFAGSLRRGKESIGDLDILITTTDPDAARAAFCEHESVLKVLARGEHKCSVRLSLEGLGGRFGGDANAAVQADLRLVPKESWGAALMYFTGSKEHNVRLRERALSKGMTLNEYGLFPEDKSDDTPPQQRGVEPVASDTEERIYKELGLPFVPPTLREDRGELELKATPELIAVGDIRAELHSHTTASDGEMSIEESAAIARDRGFHTLAITDHSKSSAVAGGLSPDRLREHIKAIRAADKVTDGIAILAGSEVDILVDGTLDYDDDLLAELDVVVASPHAGLKAKPAQATKRLLRAIEHPLVHILGHPTGRLIERRAGLEPAMDELIAAAIEHDVALEINAHWMRLDLRDTHIRAAVEAGCKLAINGDVHHASDYDNLRYGVLTAQRGWLTPDLCINTWPKKRLHDWLRAKR
ncbi:MAG: DNA polymerase/3'-5' exonuclease PolX [Phycisphaerales bacterium]|nr:DNA polymerase/3'-5' exonuclease PolX [Planctomycetota bacterium]MCH8507458.1 DNA polymerase/3'-5' exonuclease PolX [Phycisphaerales bacterium]